MSIFTYIYRLITTFFKPEEREKLRRLAALSKNIKRNNYNKLYYRHSKEASPLMAMFFFDIYRCVASYQKTLLRTSNSNVLKEILFQHYLDEKGQSLLYGISEDYIKQKAVSLDMQELTALIKKNALAVAHYFNETWFNNIDDVYHKIRLFDWFVNFDYAGILQSFIGKPAHSMAEYTDFKPLKCSQILEQLKDFLMVAAVLREKTDWNAIFAVLQQFDESFPVDNRWSKLYPSLLKVIKSNIFNLIIRFDLENSEWELEVKPQKNIFVKDYLDNLIKQGFSILNNLQKKAHTAMIQQIAERVFSKQIPDAAHFYSDSENETLVASNYHQFTKTKQFNYVLSFFHIYSEEIQELINVFLIKGTWVAREYAVELSQINEHLKEQFQALVAFDKSFGAQGQRGIKLRSYISKAGIGKRFVDGLNKYVDTVNVEAHDIISQTRGVMDVLHKQFKALDAERGGFLQTMVKNWDELDALLKNSMPLDECTQRISDLIDLIDYIDYEETQENSLSL